MSSSFGGGVGGGGGVGLSTAKPGGAPRTIWDAHFTSRSEGTNIHDAAAAAAAVGGGVGGGNHYYSSVPLKGARDTGSPTHTSSSESLGKRVE